VSANLVDPNSPITARVDERENHFDAEKQLPGLGGPTRVQVGLHRGWLRPAWAAVCGALASGELTWSSEPLFRLALLIVLVDIVWGGLWSALITTDWATPLGRWQSWKRGTPVRILPYTSPEGPAGHLAQALGQLRSWWREVVRPTLGPTLTGLALLLPVAIVVAAVLGTLPLLATLAAISLVQLVFTRTGGDSRPAPSLQAVVVIGLPWLAGHALFGNPTLVSALAALAFTISFAGGLRLALGWSGLVRWNLGQIAAVIVLVALGESKATGIAGVLFFSQVILQPGLFDGETDGIMPNAAARFPSVAQPWLMGAMLVTAWGIAAASG
jgi:hypothetical protein